MLLVANITFLADSIELSVQCSVISRTEATFLQTEIQNLNYLEYGVEEYEYKVELNPCPICQGLSGKAYKLENIVLGLNAASMHPWCKCRTSPLTDRLKENKGLKLE